MTPRAWRAKEPFVASAYSPAPTAGRITQRVPKLPLRMPLPFAASATSSSLSARSTTFSEKLWISAIVRLLWSNGTEDVPFVPFCNPRFGRRARSVLPLPPPLLALVLAALEISPFPADTIRGREDREVYCGPAADCPSPSG